MDPTDEQCRRLLQASPDGILVSRAGRIHFLNPAASRIFGTSHPESLHDAATVDLFHPDHRAAVLDSLKRAGRGDPVDALVATIVRPDGALSDVEILFSRLDEAVEPTVQIALRDVTERRRAETALRESEERLTLALTGAREGVWDWNLETGAVNYSARWKEMLGYSEDEIEPHVSAWERLLHPEDRARADELTESLARGAQTYEGEFRLRHKEGHFVHVMSRGFPVRREPGGPVVRIVGLHLDISDRKRAEAALRESEERLRLAFAGAQEGVWDWSLETGSVVYSARWKQMLGYADDEIEPHVRAWERLLHPDDRPRAEQLNESLARGAQTTKANSGCATRTATSFTSSHAAFRCVTSPMDRSFASSARISI